MARTSITLDAELFERADAAAKELGISRSRLFAMALREFLVQEENRDLLQRLNAIAFESTREDITLRAGMKRKQRRILAPGIG